jgi:hypothetical protein
MMVLKELMPRKFLHLPHQQKLCDADGKSDGKAQNRPRPIPLTMRVWTVY